LPALVSINSAVEDDGEGSSVNFPTLPKVLDRLDE